MGQPPRPTLCIFMCSTCRPPESHMKVVEVTLPTQTPEWSEETRLLRITQRKPEFEFKQYTLDEGSGNLCCRLCLAHLLFLNSW